MSNASIELVVNATPPNRPRRRAAATTTDPVLSAIAEWRALTAVAEPLRAAVARAYEEFSSVKDETLYAGVTFLGITVRTVEEWESAFGGGKVSFRGPMGEAGLKLRAALVRQVKEREEAWNRYDMQGKEDALTEALGEVWALEPRIMALTPTTAAGARELLEFVAYWLEDNRDYSLAELRDEGADFDPAAAIQRALAVLAASGTEGNRHA